MIKKIAVYLGFAGQTVPFTEPGNIIIYEKRKGVWRNESQMAFSLNQYRGLAEIRKRVNDLINFLGDCKIFVAKTITGASYYQLEKAGCSVWEYSGRPSEFMDFILDKEEEVEMENDTLPVIPEPEAFGNGLYRINLKPVQELDLGVSTKQVLLPFLRRGDYYQLEIICNHLPPWLEAELLFSKLAFRCDKNVPGEVYVTINKKVCNEN